mmetsp:Transcript_4199/g.10181  ORF Transcript_4199/g.10181 Transcript_4199/m.10181 type:complete len:90 (+) Transcript_4199:884-1153(+)
MQRSNLMLNRGSVKIGIRECLEKLPHIYLTSIHLFQETTFIGPEIVDQTFFKILKNIFGYLIFANRMLAWRHRTFFTIYRMPKVDGPCH